MKEVLFNFHDLVLVMTALQCCFFALLLITTDTKHSPSNYLLAAFLVTHAFIPMHELILWGESFRIKVKDTFPNIYIVANFAYYLDAVLLFFYTKTLVFANVKFRVSYFIHAVPCVAFIVYMLLAFYVLPSYERVELIENRNFIHSWHYISIDMACKFLRVIYCIYAILLIHKYKDTLKETQSDIENISITWLNLLVIGFLTVMAMEALLSFTKFIGLFVGLFKPSHTIDFLFFEILGLTGYYAVFFLITLLVFTSTKHFNSFEKEKEKAAQQAIVQAEKTNNKSWLNPDISVKIDRVMRDQKLYLLPNISLDMLAEEINIPSRDLSAVINRLFNFNFYEFINHYRIEEVKILLADSENSTKTIAEIYMAAGFNSKSVFNTFFKKFVGITPSNYRKTALQKTSKLNNT